MLYDVPLHASFCDAFTVLKCTAFQVSSYSNFSGIPIVVADSLNPKWFISFLSTALLMSDCPFVICAAVHFTT